MVKTATTDINVHTRRGDCPRCYEGSLGPSSVIEFWACRSCGWVNYKRPIVYNIPKRPPEMSGTNYILQYSGEFQEMVGREVLVKVLGARGRGNGARLSLHVICPFCESAMTVSDYSDTRQDIENIRFHCTVEINGNEKRSHRIRVMWPLTHDLQATWQ